MSDLYGCIVNLRGGAMGCGYPQNMTGKNIVLWLVIAKRDTIEIAEKVVQILCSLLVAQPVVLVTGQERARFQWIQIL